MTTKVIANKDARVEFIGRTALIAAAAGADASKGNRFLMTLYTGGFFYGHWYYGDVILDLTGFKPTRVDLPALHNHMTDRVAGSTDKVGVVGKEIIAEGAFLDGTWEQEPVANRIKSRLAQSFPYQCSGYWEPKSIEEVMAGATANVNGVTVNGPITIFREYDLGEASFVEMGWDNQTRAVAAGKQDGEITVSVTTTGATTMTTTSQTKPGILATLNKIFGAAKAIEFVTAHPDRTEVGQFTEELVTAYSELSVELTTAKQTIATKDAEITKLNADLVTAKARPAVITGNGDSPNGGATPPNTLPEGEEKWKAEFKTSKQLQDEFGAETSYVAFKKNESRVTIK